MAAFPSNPLSTLYQAARLMLGFGPRNAIAAEANPTPSKSVAEIYQAIVERRMTDPAVTEDEATRAAFEKEATLELGHALRASLVSHSFADYFKGLSALEHPVWHQDPVAINAIKMASGLMTDLLIASIKPTGKDGLNPGAIFLNAYLIARYEPMSLDRLQNLSNYLLMAAKDVVADEEAYGSRLRQSVSPGSEALTTSRQTALHQAFYALVDLSMWFQGNTRVETELTRMTRRVFNHLTPEQKSTASQHALTVTRSIDPSFTVGRAMCAFAEETIYDKWAQKKDAAVEAAPTNGSLKRLSTLLDRALGARSEEDVAKIKKSFAKYADPRNDNTAYLFATLRLLEAKALDPSAMSADRPTQAQRRALALLDAGLATLKAKSPALAAYYTTLLEQRAEAAALRDQKVARLAIKNLRPENAQRPADAGRGPK
jgi:hypothetical protein